MEKKDTKDLAALLHDKLCKDNHTDGCGWFYEIRNGVHEWNRDTHAGWLNKADTISFNLYNKNGRILENPATFDLVKTIIESL